MFNVLYSVINSPSGNPFVVAVLICTVMFLVTFFTAFSHGFERACANSFRFALVFILISVPAVFILTGGLAIFVLSQIIGSCLLLILSILDGALIGGLGYRPTPKEVVKSPTENDSSVRKAVPNKETEKADLLAKHDKNSITRVSPFAAIAIIAPQVAYVVFSGYYESDKIVDFNITIRSKLGEYVSFNNSFGCDHIRRINSAGYKTLDYSTIIQSEGAVWQLYGLDCNKILGPNASNGFRYEALKITNNTSAELYLIFDKSPHELVSASYEEIRTEFLEERDVEPTEFNYEGPYFYHRISLVEIPPQLLELTTPTLLRGETLFCEGSTESLITRRDIGGEMQSYLAINNIASYVVGQLVFDQNLNAWEIADLLDLNLPFHVLQIENPLRDISSQEPLIENCLLLNIGEETIEVNTRNLDRNNSLLIYYPEDKSILSIRRLNSGLLEGILSPRFFQWSECSTDISTENMEDGRYYVSGNQVIKVKDGVFTCQRMKYGDLPI